MRKYDKELYEKQIAKTQLFSLEKGTVAYTNEAFKLVELLYLYILSWGEEKYAEYSCEIVTTANRCIDNYDVAGNTPFINYFTGAWKKEYRRALRDKAFDEKYGGMHFTRDEKAKMRLYREAEKKAMSLGIDTLKHEFFVFLIECTGWDISECLSVQGMICGGIISESQQSEDGENISLFDAIPDTNLITKDIEDRDSFEACLSRIEAIFVALQDRQKPLISSLMTARLLSEVGEYILSREISIDQYSFFDINIVRSYIRFGTLPSQKDIAQSYGKLESSVSRSLRIFLKALKEYISF